MIVFAAVFGVLAVFLAQAWLNSQAEMRAKNLDALKKPLATQTVVVASKPLRFGAELGAMSLREVPWPQEAVPSGAFSKIADLTTGGRRSELDVHPEHLDENRAAVGRSFAITISPR